jgi:Zn-dependent metalloprotease
VGAAIVAVGLALAAMSALALVAGAVGAGKLDLSAHTLHVAVDDGAATFYLTQMVSLSFFHHTAGLRFAALPGLILVGLAIATAAMVAARVTHGSTRRRMLLATLTAVPYALLSGLGSRYVPLRFTAPGIGNGVPVQPSMIEAFALSLGWALLFAPLGGLVGVFGMAWRRETARLLAAWATPLRCSLRALAAGLALTSVLVLVGGAVLVGQSGDTHSLLGGGFSHAVAVVGVALIALPTLVVSMFLACFGVSFDWQVEALTGTHGSGSIFGGTLPSTGANLAHEIPGLPILLLLLVSVTAFSAGWLTARRSEENVRLSMASALRAGALMTLICWLFGLVSRVDVQAGGLLGLYVEVDVVSLLWRVPLWCFLGSVAGSVAYLASRGALVRRQFADALLAVARPSHGPRAYRGLLDSSRQGLASRAAMGISFLLLPAMLIGMGSAGIATSAGTATISLAPIHQAAEQRLRRDAVPGEHLSVTVNPSTRVVDTASVRIPVHALGGSPSQSPVLKAKTALAHYGDLFGLSQRPAELGEPREVTDWLAKTDRIKVTHVYFKQMVDGVPVFTGGIGVHFSPDGQYLTFVSGSIVPEVSVADDTVAINSTRAVSLAKAALPAGELAQPPKLEVYAGAPSHPVGPTARLAWFVWLMDPARGASNEYVVDAVDGVILNVLPKTEYALHRDVYNANHETTLPGKLARKEGEGATGDEDIDNAYKYTGDVYNYYYEILGRDSYDNSGAALVSSAHYGKEYKNAFWNGKQMVFGDGYASALDVVGHELTHAVTASTANEVDEGQFGSLNEGFSDSMGEWIEYETTKKADWVMGASLPGGAIRSLKEPKIYSEVEGRPDPEKLSEYVPTCEDNLGVHENSTIISHAFYLLATSSIGVQAAGEVFYHMQVEYLHEHSTFEDARNAALEYALVRWGSGSSQYKAVESAFNAVGLNGVAEPHAIECGISFECSFVRALQDQQAASGSSSTLSMLATLYRARGELAQSSAAGDYFMPLYEENMGRITELESRDPTLEEMAVGGLQEITPALNALMEGEGKKFKLSASEMARIEAALRRLAQDDRLFSGGGSLAELIEHELKWLRLPTYAGMTYAAGFKRLNTAVVAHSESPPPPATFIVDPNCGGTPYGNEFEIHGFHVDTPGHYQPGEVSPMVSSGVVCGTSVEKAGSQIECRGEGTLNTRLTLELPPGDKVNSTTKMTNGSWVGEAIGRAVACAGSESRIVYGGAGIKSVKSWTAAQCPVSAIACYEGEATYEGHSGHSYSWVTEEAGKRLVLTTGPVEVEVEKHKVPVGFTEFGVKLCARAGEPGTKTCGTGTAPWVHENGEASQPGCPTEDGLYVAHVTNSAMKTTSAARSCVHWGEEAYKQAIDAGNSLNAVSCVPATTECVALDNKGNALYSTNVSATASATWKMWSGPASPGEAVACPASSLCALADGKVSEGGGGNMYYATSLGGSWNEAFKPAHGVLAISCPSSSFCVDAQESGQIRYSTKPASTSWTAVTAGSGALNGVSCLSSSFCAVVNGSGDLYVANTEAHIKEVSGWKSTDIDGSTALQGVACTSTTSCLAVDSAGNVLDLTINGSGEATASKHDIDGTTNLTAITCTKEFTCVAVDNKGNVFVSTSSGETWNNQHATGANLTSVSCASSSLCVTADTSGNVTAFHPAGVPPNHTQEIDAGNSVNAVSCVPATTECVAVDNKGNALYSLTVSATASATWKLWSGPASPGEAVACPASSLCTFADGKVSEGTGGNMYYATSLGGSWKEAFSPAFGVFAVSCPSSSFCVDGQEGGFIRYSTKPASTSWTSLGLGAATMNAVFCLSASFCAVADSSGNVWVANTEAHVKEVPGWKSTDVDGTTALHGVACSSTTFCVAVDGEGNVLDLTISSSGEATASKQDIDGKNNLTAITCTGGFTCITVDNTGNVFVSSNGGETWNNEHTLGTDLTSISCSVSALCLAGDTSGDVTAFDAG